MERTIPQTVFDSREARRIIEAGTREAIADLERMPRHMLSESNPNHPSYDLHLFGEHYVSFMGKQYK